MAEDLQSRFENATQEVTKLAEAPDNMAKLKLYALFKQASVGDATGARPGMMDFVGRAKYDAWTEFKGQTTDQAKEAYIAFVDELKAADKK